jgi:hypothetical protein
MLKSTALILVAALAFRAGEVFAGTEVSYLEPGIKTAFTGALNPIQSPNDELKSCGKSQLDALSAVLREDPSVSAMKVQVDISNLSSKPYHWEELIVGNLPWVKGYDALVENGVLRIHARSWGQNNCEIAPSDKIREAVKEWRELSAPVAGNWLSNGMRWIDVGTQPPAAANPASGTLAQKPSAEPQHEMHAGGKPGLAEWAAEAQ